MHWRVRYEKYQTVLGPTGLERSDIFHNELFSAYNKYVLLREKNIVQRDACVAIKRKAWSSDRRRDQRTNVQTDRQTDRQKADKLIPMWSFAGAINPIWPCHKIKFNHYLSLNRKRILCKQRKKDEQILQWMLRTSMTRARCLWSPVV